MTWAGPGDDIGCTGKGAISKSLVYVRCIVESGLSSG